METKTAWRLSSGPNTRELFLKELFPEGISDTETVLCEFRPKKGLLIAKL